ncbi:MAG TPA: zinc-dependent metalloprotease [Stackebrandtia sp.]|jgi:putative hydrolase|uniref:zinc-dependent metalloprotease n=1 Tax=Stackebrandtia sp. TaxID=2023065 RepID=UPI002D253096|nr:zinc-dependent metalloprotease [Stackebrandtia sp.]HZE39105.1 zinc-dependent metalloprotease [Stackebrandtia sp.]
MQQMMAQLQQMMQQQSGSGPVNWDLARQVANEHIGDDPMVDSVSSKANEETLRLADLWLENTTTLPSGISTTASWTRKDWVAHTVGTWKELAEPLAAKMSQALGEMVPEDVRGLLGPMANLMQGIGSTLFGAQLGQALAELSKEVITSTEIGLPLGPAGTAVILPANLAEYADGMTDIPRDDVRLYVALRETAHHRLYGHVPWLRAHMIGAVEAYANGIHIDQSAIEAIANDFDLSDGEAIQQIDLSQLMRPDDTPAQRAAVARLEHMLALVGGWVSHVAAEAAGDKLPSLSKLTETARRRRATNGPSERTFEALVGLQLSPKKLREATVLWDKITRVRGVEGRDAVWNHPDLMPTPEDLDNPDAFAENDAEIGDLDMSIFDQLAVNDPKPPKKREDSEDDED